ncbi:MAG: PilZ domain-containing protein [Spirochaetales bacterium]|nr:PilZ domain-containing protein [Spirochaetales bacterium]
MDRNNFEARKVFFLYPHSVIQKELVQELVANEYEVYLVMDHKRLREIISEYDQPIVYINIDDNLQNKEWEEYINEMISSDDNNARVGVLTYNEDQRLAQHYLMDLMISCGFIKLKLGLEQSKKIILKTLEVNEAKGRRKYLRMNCWEHRNADFNVKIQGSFFTGRIKDISSVGMAFVFNEDLVLSIHSVVSDIQLKLRGKIARVSGPVMGTRVIPEGTVHVLVFDKKTDLETRGKIHAFIYETLQDQIRQKLSG